jgi:hypothetical protein
MGSVVRLLLDRMRMMREDAVAVGQVIDEAFQGQSELDDERLDKDLRQVFYDLQDEKILDVRRVEVRDERGQQRRHYMWRVREDDLPEPAAAPAHPDPAERLYHKLPESHWERRVPTDDAGFA